MASTASKRYAHQAGDLRRLRAATAGELWRVLYVAFMGSGKTHVAARLIKQWTQNDLRTLILVHRREVLEQTWSKLLDAGFFSDDVGVTWQDDPRARPGALVQLASIDTLIRRSRPPSIARIVIDEAHHAPASKWQRVLGWYPGVPVLGLTGTPERLDGKPLGPVFDVMVESRPVERLIQQGCINRPKVWTREDGWLPSMRGKKKVGGDWKKGDAAEVMSGPTIVGELPRHWRKHARGLPTVGFAATIEQADKLAKTFRRAGIRSELFTSRWPSGRLVSHSHQNAALERLRSGVTQVLWTCDILGEGWNFPAARCAILARPTASLARYLQWCGRVMRAGSPPPVILDHAGNYYVHGLPWQEQGWSLTEGRPSKTLVARADSAGRVRLVAPTEVPGKLIPVSDRRQAVCVGWDGNPCPTQARPGAWARLFGPHAKTADWRCRHCASKNWIAKLTPEERKAKTVAALKGAKKKWARMSPMERVDEAASRFKLDRKEQARISRRAWNTTLKHRRVAPTIVDLLRQFPEGLTLAEVATALEGKCTYHNLNTLINTLRKKRKVIIRSIVILRGHRVRKYALSRKVQRA